MSVGGNFLFSAQGKIGLRQVVFAHHVVVKVCSGQTDIGVAIVEKPISLVVVTITRVNDVAQLPIELMRIYHNFKLPRTIKYSMRLYGSIQ